MFAGVYVLYQVVRGLISTGNLYKPFGDAMKIINLERTLHVFVEPSVQAWALSKHWLMDSADWAYLYSHYAVTGSVLIFIYLRRNGSFYFVRNMFIVAMLIALVGYAVFPTAPPALMPEWGFTDAISQFLGVAHVDSSGATSAFVNVYAAVPSMHVCFAVMTGWPMARLVQRRWREDRVVPVSAVDHVRGRRDRQPLLHRRVPRRADRRHLGTARQEAAGAGQARCLGFP